MSQLTEILAASQRGESQTSSRLLPLVSEELRRRAAHYLAQEKPGQTLRATALVHEAWLRLVANEDPHWSSQRHFFGAAAEAMRCILVDNTRRRLRRKHDGHLERMDADHVDIPSPLPEDQLPAVDEALDRLAAVNPRAAEVVNLRFFADLTEEQIAQQLDISVATVERTWAFARAWLFHEIQQDLAASSPVRENAPENRT